MLYQKHCSIREKKFFPITSTMTSWEHLVSQEQNDQFEYLIIPPYEITLRRLHLVIMNMPEETELTSHLNNLS